MYQNSIFSVIFLLTTFGECGGSHPNILFIMADDLGWNDVSWNNPKMPTPNLHNLAMNGAALLYQSYVNQVCSSTRSAFLTGHYPFHIGTQGDAVFTGMEPSGVPLKFPFLPQFLKKLGYNTSLIGKWHLGYCKESFLPTARGFDYFYGLYCGKQDYYTHHYSYTEKQFKMDGLDLWDMSEPQFSKNGTYSTEMYASKAIEVIQKTNSKQPFFMFLAFTAPHYPLQVPAHYLENCVHYKHHKRHLYCGMMNALDKSIGRVIDALNKTGLYNNTIIIFNTDNGGEVRFGGSNFPLRGNKHTLWEGGNRAISFVHAPAFIRKPGVRHKQLFTIVDWFPTILTAAGQETKKYGDGVNQWDMIVNGSAGVRHSFTYNVMANLAAVRRGRYKLIVGNATKFNKWYPEPTSRKQDKIVPPEEKSPYLFDLKKDPTEHFNLAKRLPKIVNKLLRIIKQRKKEKVPSVHRDLDKRGDPNLYNGTYETGWC